MVKNALIDNRTDEQVIQDITGRVMSIGELEGYKVGLLRIAYTELGKKLKQVDSSYKSVSSSGFKKAELIDVISCLQGKIANKMSGKNKYRTEAVTTEAVATEAVATEAVATEAVTTEAVATEAVATESVATEAVATESVATEAVATEAVATESVATESVATEAVTTEALKDTEDEYQSYEQKLETLSQCYYNNLKKYTLNLCTQNRLFLPEYFEMIPSFKVGIEIAFGNNIYTITNATSQILKRIGELVNAEAHLFPKDMFLDQYQNFYKSIKALMAEYSKAKHTNSIISLNERQNNTIDVEVCDLLIWAKSQLQNLPRIGTNWTEVAIAIMCLTGRRQSEIMCTGHFTYIDDNYVLFNGQLKKHDTSKDAEAYKIPVLLGSAKEVIAGIEWLDKSRKRVEIINSNYQDAAKKSHDKYSRYLSASVKDLLSKYVRLSNSDDTWYHDGKDRKKCHLLRQIYAQVAYPLFFKGSKQKLNQVIASIMGHNDDLSASRASAVCYDADVIVVDTKDIELYSKI